jgi:hypothetical protein
MADKSESAQVMERLMAIRRNVGVSSKGSKPGPNYTPRLRAAAWFKEQQSNETFLRFVNRLAASMLKAANQSTTVEIDVLIMQIADALAQGYLELVNAFSNERDRADCETNSVPLSPRQTLLAAIDAAAAAGDKALMQKLTKELIEL